MSNSSGFSFPKKNRLLKSSDFEGLRSESQVYKSKEFKVVYKKNEADSRLGVAVSRKFAKAVGRNRIKRELREGFRSSKLKESAFDFLFIINPRLKPQFDEDSKSYLDGFKQSFDGFVSYIQRRTNA